MVDAAVSNTAEHALVRVRVPPSVPMIRLSLLANALLATVLLAASGTALAAVPSTASDAPTDSSRAQLDPTDTPARRDPATVATMDAELRFRASQAAHLRTLQAGQGDLLRGVFQRIRGGARYRATGFDAYIQIQTAGAMGTAVQFDPDGLSGGADVPVPVGLQQGWVRWRPANLDSVQVQLGRMALEYGDGRRIGGYDFHESGNAFDGLRVGYSLPPFLAVDLLAVTLRRNIAQPERERYLFGVYVASKPVSEVEVDLYLLELRDGDEDLRANHLNMGLRSLWRPKYWLTLQAEGAVQFGAVRPKGYANELDHFATSFAASVELQGHVGIPLGVALQFQRHSGDPNPVDDQSTAWRPLYPSLARHIGLLQLFPQSNLVQYGSRLRVGRDKEMRFIMDWRVNAAMSGSVLPAFNQPRLEYAKTWAPLGSELDSSLHVPFGGRSELMVLFALFVPSQLLADAVGGEAAQQFMVQWSTQF